jgi:hypothetical protein
MGRSKIFDDLLNSITPEEEEKWKKERIEFKNKLTLDYQLGVFVGKYIVHRFLPTLSTDMIRSGHVIQVSETDSLENERLDNDWYDTTKSGGKWNEDDVNEKWERLLSHNKILSKKYLPNPLKCLLPVLNINNIVDFKNGLKSELWDCDICSYNIEPENIKIYDDEDCLFTTVELQIL